MGCAVRGMSNFRVQEQLDRAISDSDKKFLQQRVDILDKQINTVVYGLYRLTADEVKVIEGRKLWKITRMQKQKCILNLSRICLVQKTYLPVKHILQLQKIFVIL